MAERIMLAVPEAVAKRVQLADLLVRYRRGMVRKAEALKVAVDRGLQPPSDPGGSGPRAIVQVRDDRGG